MQRLKMEFEFSERHACELMSIPRSSYRYQTRRDDSVLREQLIELAREKPMGIKFDVQYDGPPPESK